MVWSFWLFAGRHVEVEIRLDTTRERFAVQIIVPKRPDHPTPAVGRGVEERAAPPAAGLGAIH
jgi:hypothetical protein